MTAEACWQTNWSRTQLPDYLGNKTQKDGVERDGVSLPLIPTTLLKNTTPIYMLTGVTKNRSKVCICAELQAKMF